MNPSSSHKSPTDAELLDGLRRDDPAALDALFRRHYTVLCRVALRFVADREQSEDIVQDFFVSLWERRARLPDDLQVVGAYFRRSVRNRSLNHLRNQGRIPVDDGELPEVYSSPNVIRDMENEELKQQIHRAIDQLPERCRLVFTMSKLEDMSNREIANSLDISPKTVENQMTRAYKFLRKFLSVLISPLAVVFYNFLFALSP